MTNRQTFERPWRDEAITASLMKARLLAKSDQVAQSVHVLGGDGVPAEPSTEFLKRAAVAMVVREASKGVEILLIKRALRPSDPWSGHMAFPGGHQEPGDQDLVRTAIRETQEEVGVELGGQHLWGPLGIVETPRRSSVRRLHVVPFVFEAPPEPRFTINGEVDETHWVSIAELMSGERDTQHTFEFDGQSLKLPGYHVGGHVVWGMTYRMLQMLFELVKGD